MNYSINGAARVVGNVKYFVNRSANQIVGASDLAKSIFKTPTVLLRAAANLLGIVLLTVFIFSEAGRK